MSYLDNAALTWVRAFMSVHAGRFRRAMADGDRGASAVELAVITAVIVAIAVALLAVINTFVKTESGKITPPANP
jgi:Flp pilus assembly pilin Flp